MTLVVRTIVMWLIALAIPMQGVASVVMPLCAPAQDASASASVHARAAPHLASASLVGAADLPLQHAAAAGHPAASGHGEGASPGDFGHAGHGVLKCCSVACSMAAVVAPSLATLVPARSPAPLHPVAQLYRGVTPDGLDRPPKFILA